MDFEAFERRISSSSSKLIGATLRIVGRLLKEGKSPDEIADIFSSYIPSTERHTFTQQLDSIMMNIAAARDEGFADVDIRTLIAASHVSFPKLADSIRDEVERAARIAAMSGEGQGGVFRRLLEKREEQMSEKMKTLANTAMAAFNNNLTFLGAADDSLFKYFGPVAPSTRPFCLAHVGRVFTLKQIMQMDNGQGLPVAQNCGGYNCRHEWLRVDGRTAIKERVHTTGPTAIGRQKYVLDEQSRDRLFERYKLLYVEHRRSQEDDEWYRTARAVARAFDSVKPLGENFYPDGIWAQYKRSRGRSNFEHHAERHRASMGSDYRREYTKMIYGVLASRESLVGVFTAGDGSTRIIIHNPSSNWLVMLDANGHIHTAFEATAKTTLLKGTRALNALKRYIG